MTGGIPVMSGRADDLFLRLLPDLYFIVNPPRVSSCIFLELPNSCLLMGMTDDTYIYISRCMAHHHHIRMSDHHSMMMLEGVVVS